MWAEVSFFLSLSRASRTIRVAASIRPRENHRTELAASCRLRGISTWQPRRRRDPVFTDRPGRPADESARAQVITTVLYDRGGFQQAIGTIMMCAGVAAIMSTADSSIIANSQLFAEDLYKKRIDPTASHAKTLVASKVSSLVTCIIAVLWSREDEFDIGYCAALQLGFQLLAFPPYFFGLYPELMGSLTGGKSPSSRSLILGWMIGAAVFVRARTRTGSRRRRGRSAWRAAALMRPAPAEISSDWSVPAQVFIVVVLRNRANERVEVWLQPGVWGFFANMAMIVFVEAYGPPAWRDDFARDDYDLPPEPAMDFEHAPGAEGRKGLTDEQLVKAVGPIVGDPLVGATSRGAVALALLLVVVQRRRRNLRADVTTRETRSASAHDRLGTRRYRRPGGRTRANPRATKSPAAGRIGLSGTWRASSSRPSSSWFWAGAGIRTGRSPTRRGRRLRAR